jgi:hypothetical protein
MQEERCGGLLSSCAGQWCAVREAGYCELKDVWLMGEMVLICC